MKYIFTIILFFTSFVSLSQNSIDTLISNNTWLCQNHDSIMYKYNDLQEDNGSWEITKDSIIIISHCYKHPTYFKVEFISNDSMILRVFKNVWEENGTFIGTISPTERRYYFQAINSDNIDKSTDPIRIINLNIENIIRIN